MSSPSCPKYENGSFTMKEFEPRGSAFRLMAVCCSSCGAVVGVMDYFNIGSMLDKLGKRLGVNLT